MPRSHGRLVILGQELVDPRLFVPIDDGLKRSGEPCVGIDGVEFTCLNERRQHGPVLGSGIVTGKEGVLSVQGNRADGALNGIVVQLDATIFQKQARPIPIFGDVFEGFAER